jgi:long-chain fatty acid transport protein
MAAGFEVAENSGKLLGHAYAGKAALAEDASTAFYNPAGLTRIKGFQAVFSYHALLPNGEWKDDGSTGAGGGALGGGDGGDPGELVHLPCMYLVAPVDDNLRFGLSVNAPYGLKTEYNDGWQGRYHALTSELVTININPSVAWRIDEMFSVGFGVNIQRAEATLSSAIDFGAIAVDALGMKTAAMLGLLPETVDGEGEVTGDDWSFGWNIGVLVELDEKTRFGVAYRSPVRHTIEGDADFTVPSAAAPLREP